MSKDTYVYRIHENAAEQPVTENGWHETSGIDTIAIASMKDSLDKLPSSGKVGTSIPTPLARIHLFKTAFDLVSAPDSTRKIGIYDELVSDCLDILQLLFEKGADSSKFQFKRWSAQSVVTTLRRQNAEIAKYNPEYSALTLLANAFELALGSSKDFGDEIFLIEYDGMLLGGTSPYTLVYTSPNLRYELERRRASAVGYDFSSNKKKEFCGNQKIHLSERPMEFQVFLKSFVNDSKFFDKYFTQGAPLRTFADYVNAQTVGVKIDMTNFDASYPPIKNLECIPPLRYNELSTIPTSSDFMMKPSVSYYEGQGIKHIPLVLPSEFPELGWTYIDDNWDTKTQIPNRKLKEEGNQVIGERRLPKNGSTQAELTSQKYPWVSDGDFLCDTLIDLSYDVNTKYFFCKTEKYPRFLIPIKKEYFMFFTLADLERNLKITVDAKETRNASGEVAEVRLGSVSVELTIPLKSNKGSLVLKREYRAEDTSRFKIKKAKYGVGLGIYPFYRLDEKETGLHNQYSVYLYDSSQSADSVSLKFYNNKDLGNPISADMVKRTSEKSGTSKVYSLNKPSTSMEFDLIEVSIPDDGGNGIDTGLVIPQWGDRFITRSMLGGEQERAIFSVDFGTSNTHVAYYNPYENAVHPLEISADEQQMVLLNKPYEKDGIVDYRDARGFGLALPRFTEYLREFMPSVVGTGKRVSYPIKTATLENGELNKGKKLFGNINIGYDIENERVQLPTGSVFNYTTDLKWALQKESAQKDIAKLRVSAFFEQTLWTLKNLIVLKRLYPQDIQIIYFFPESMSESDQLMFENAWNENAIAIFTDYGFSLMDGKCKKELESVVPYYSLLRTYKDLYAYNSVNIDIGGGTTDILIYDRKFKDKETDRTTAAYESSLYFAGNDIWGKIFPEQSTARNGFVEFMKSKVASCVLSPETAMAYKYFNKKDDPAELSTFFFKYKDFDYAGKIASNAKLKYVLFLHYASIIYYVCDMIKQVRKEQNPDFVLPATITFTGKGSEYIKILTPNEDSISKITFALFLAYGFEAKEFEKFRVAYPKNPKGLTAEGGIYKLIADPNITVEFVKKEDDFVQMGGGTTDNRSTTEYENFCDYLIGFDKDPSKTYINNDVVDYKPYVMKHFEDMIDCIFGNDLLKRTLKTVGINIEDSDKDLTIKLAGYSYENQAKYYSEVRRRGNEGSSAVKGTLFFLALKDLLIELSNEYVK